MSDKEKIPIFPTRMNLSLTGLRLKSSEKGYNLLKRKSDALLVRHKKINNQLQEEMNGLRELCNEAKLRFSQAEYLGGNVGLFLHECRKYPVEIHTETENVSGIILPTFTLHRVAMKSPLFLEKSSQALSKCRDMYFLVLERMLAIASLKNSFLILDEVMAKTNRRVNALEFFLIPRLKNTIDYINSELDEQDREEFFRLKKVQSKNKEIRS